jgi:hypothetical protein
MIAAPAQVWGRSPDCRSGPDGGLSKDPVSRIGVTEAVSGICTLMLPRAGGLFHGDAFGEVARLIDVGALDDRGVVGQELDRDRV